VNLYHSVLCARFNALLCKRIYLALSEQTNYKPLKTNYYENNFKHFSGSATVFKHQLHKRKSQARQLRQLSQILLIRLPMPPAHLPMARMLAG
jgi:hypothetical protein